MLVPKMFLEFTFKTNFQDSFKEEKSQELFFISILQKVQEITFFLFKILTNILVAETESPDLPSPLFLTVSSVN